MEAFGAPKFDDADLALAKQFYDSLSEEQKASAVAELSRFYGREKAAEMIENPLHTEILPLIMVDYAMPGSTDVGDVSYVTPTAQFTMATTALGTSPHTWQMTAQGNTSIALKGVKTAASVMAMAAVQVIEDPSIAEKAREELNEETGGKYICPIPADVQPNIK